MALGLLLHLLIAILASGTMHGAAPLLVPRSGALRLLPSRCRQHAPHQAECSPPICSSPLWASAGA